MAFLDTRCRPRSLNTKRSFTVMILLEDLTTTARERLLSLARAANARQKSTHLSPITPIDRDQPLELSLKQQGLWFVSRFEKANRAYHIAGGIQLVGELDRAALRRALDRICGQTRDSPYHISRDRR